MRQLNPPPSTHLHFDVHFYGCQIRLQIQIALVFFQNQKEALPSNKFLNVISIILHLFGKTQMFPGWSHQPTSYAIPTALLGTSCSSIGKLRVLPSWKHIPFWGCWTPPSNCGRDLRVWPSILASSSPSLRPLAPLESCPSSASHPLNLATTTEFFQWIVITPIDVFTFFQLQEICSGLPAIPASPLPL